MGYRKITFLEELIMISMLHQPRYGLEIIEVVSGASGGEFDLNLGTLFTALGRLSKKNLIEPRVVPKKDRNTSSGSRKYYQITEEGRALLNQIASIRKQTGFEVDPLTATSSFFAVRRTPRTGRGFIEPRFDVGDAIPLHMVRIPGGTFMMGSPEDEPEREEAEGPQHEVTVPMFFMGRYPITQAQYERVMETNPAAQYDTERFIAPNKPVVGVSWHDAVAFCQRLSALTKRAYRLPSEAEWGYACRAGTLTPFAFGKTLTTEVANYNGNDIYGDGPKGEYRQKITPVDHFGTANAFGLCDMHGNVLEWCADHWHDNYDGAPTDGSAWVEGGDSSLCVLRGGSWDLDPRGCRSACRGRTTPDIISLYIGFRVVCSAPRALQ